MNKYFNKQDWRLVAFKKSKTKHKKYDAILVNMYTGRTRKVAFGDKREEHYKDQVHLGLYKYLDHGDQERKRLYRARHKHNLKKGYYSAGWFSYYFLW